MDIDRGFWTNIFFGVWFIVKHSANIYEAFIREVHVLIPMSNNIINTIHKYWVETTDAWLITNKKNFSELVYGSPCTITPRLSG